MKQCFTPPKHVALFGLDDCDSQLHVIPFGCGCALCAAALSVCGRWAYVIHSSALGHALLFSGTLHVHSVFEHVVWRRVLQCTMRSLPPMVVVGLSMARPSSRVVVL